MDKTCGCSSEGLTRLFDGVVGIRESPVVTRHLYYVTRTLYCRSIVVEDDQVLAEEVNGCRKFVLEPVQQHLQEEDCLTCVCAHISKLANS